MQRNTLLISSFIKMLRALPLLGLWCVCAMSVSAQSEDGGRIEIPADQITCICPSGGPGSISVIAEGSAGPFTFLWAGPGGYASTEQNPADLPAPGQYSVTVTNAYGCEVTLEAEVPACDGVPEVELTPEPACPDSENGRIVLTFPGDDSGYTYLWSNGSTGRDLTGVGAGVFSVTITEGGGCTRVSEASIPEEQPMSLSAEVVGVCQGQSDGSIDMSVSGGQAPYTYQWSNGWPLEDMDPASSGLFKVTVTDAGNCRIIGDFTAPLHPLPAISGAVQLSSCVSAAGTSFSGSGSGWDAAVSHRAIGRCPATGRCAACLAGGCVFVANRGFDGLRRDTGSDRTARAFMGNGIGPRHEYPPRAGGSPATAGLVAAERTI